MTTEKKRTAATTSPQPLQKIARSSSKESATDTSDENTSASSRETETEEGNIPEHMGYEEEREAEGEEYYVEGIVTHELRLTKGVWKKWYLMKWTGFAVEGKEEDWVCEDDTQ